jgi:salicylate hydroxylase
MVDDYEQWFNGPNRLLAFRVPPDFIYIACAFPIAPDQPIPEELKQATALRKTYSPPGERFTAQTRWLVETICEHASEMHWARLQEHDVLYADPLSNVLYLGDSAHGMVPTLGQGATQAIEDACFAANVLAGELGAGAKNIRACLDLISAGRSERMRFVMNFSLESTDTMFAGADPVAGTLHKTEPDFQARLKRLYRDIPGLPAAPETLPSEIIA